MGFFDGITAKVTSITASFYMFRRLANSLPERIEAFKNGDYITVFLGEKIGSLFDHEDAEVANDEPVDNTVPSTEIPEMSAEAKAAMGYDDVTSLAHSYLSRLEAASLEDGDAQSECTRIEIETDVDVYMKMVKDPNFKDSGLARLILDSENDPNCKQVDIDNVNQVLAYQQQLANGEITEEELRAQLVESELQVYQEWQDGESDAYLTIMRLGPIGMTSLYDSYRGAYKENGWNLDAAYNPDYRSQTPATAALQAATLSFTSGHSVEDVVTAYAMEDSRIRQMVAQSYPDSQMQSAIMSADYVSPIQVDANTSVIDMGFAKYNEANGFPELMNEILTGRANHEFVPKTNVSEKDKAAFDAAVSKVTAAQQTQTQRDPSLQAETDALAALGDSSVSTELSYGG